MEQLKKLYDDYQAQTLKIRQSARFFDGMFGFGNDPRKHHCHEEFYEAVKGWTDAFVASVPTADAALEAASFILEAPERHRERDCFMYMFVGLGFIEPMIPCLRKADCAALAVRFNGLYPRRERMPLQKRTYEALKKAGK